MTDMVTILKKERKMLHDKLMALDNYLKTLNGQVQTRTLSDAVRKKMSDAAKKRWAAKKKS